MTVSLCGCAHDGTREVCEWCWGSSIGVSCLQTLPSASVGAVGCVLCTSSARLLGFILQHLQLKAAGSEVVDHFRSLRLIFFLYILSYFFNNGKIPKYKMEVAFLNWRFWDRLKFRSHIQKPLPVGKQQESSFQFSSERVMKRVNKVLLKQLWRCKFWGNRPLCQ